MLNLRFIFLFLILGTTICVAKENRRSTHIANIIKEDLKAAIDACKKDGKDCAQVPLAGEKFKNDYQYGFINKQDVDEIIKKLNASEMDLKNEVMKANQNKRFYGRGLHREWFMNVLLFIFTAAIVADPQISQTDKFLYGAVTTGTTLWAARNTAYFVSNRRKADQLLNGVENSVLSQLKQELENLK